MQSKDDIEVLFRHLEEHFSEAGEGSRKMLGMLVHTTLTYRDTLVARSESPLTVEETRKALDIFMTIFTTKKFPAISDPRIKELVMMWLEEVRKNVHH